MSTTFTDNALTILKARYLRKNEQGEVIETPDEMLHRVAEFLTDEDADKASIFYNLMASLDFLPNTPTLVNAGREKGQLSACFVLPVEDSMDSIFTAVKNSALIHKTGGGTGFSFSRLRGKGERVSNTGGEASGPVSFMRVFNAATESVKQGGVRRGANMGLLRVDHPDIEEFVACKDDPKELTNFNISVGITDEFMWAVENDLDFYLQDPHTKEQRKTVKAKDLWSKIVHQAWKNGEPGLIFLDHINRANQNPELGDIEATNPCGEQPLLPYESCNLGSINLANHVKGNTFDVTHLEKTVKASVDFLNAVLDHNHFPLPEIEEKTLLTRKIGLGVMGFADAMIKMGLRYDSVAAEAFAENLMFQITNMAIDHSKKCLYDNSTVTTIAPTGTISLLANVSSGIEPNFSWVYKRNSCDKVLYMVHPLMEAKLKEVGQYNDNILSKLEMGTPVSKIPELAGIGDYWQLSQEINTEAHVNIQSAFQSWTDNAVSKTINLPRNATEQDVSDAYILAFHKACKGVTVYRDGSREGQVLNFSKRKEEEKPLIRPRPEKVEGSTEVNKIGCGKLYVTVNRDKEGPIEVFTNTGKAGGCPAQSEGLARMVSLALRYGIPVEAISKQLMGIRCMSTIRKDGCHVLSCPDAIGRSLKAVAGKEPVTDVKAARTCEECGEKLEQAEGCVICQACGYSKCG